MLKQKTLKLYYQELSWKNLYFTTKRTGTITTITTIIMMAVDHRIPQSRPQELVCLSGRTRRQVTEAPMMSFEERKAAKADTTSLTSLSTLRKYWVACWTWEFPVSLDEIRLSNGRRWSMSTSRSASSPIDSSQLSSSWPFTSVWQDATEN